MPTHDPKHGGPSVDLQKERETRLFRRARRKARERAGEIKELNIVAMMDMMTILLVFLLKSYQASTLSVNMGSDLTIPVSSTQLAPQENISVTVSLNELAVNDRAVVPLDHGLIPAKYKDGQKAEAFYVGAVYDALKKEVDKQKYIAQYNKNAPFSGRINVIADKKITYRTLMEVLYTAGQAELGEYKFMVMKNE
ncbi:MAG TPA: biopolymer transporter ExbD [Anaeromyxobacteraceae bacterium]|jgi:biopolymer transport protein ExbD|nr:biopolymer transporter ExbD [Anaeromyxobacteraceae bacterium]